MSESEKFEAVVVGSGFGGTITALTLAKFLAKQMPKSQVCILERGRWWISHEIPSNKPRPPQPNMREYLEDHQIPHGFWAYPDNVEGEVKLLFMARQISRTGLYDYRVLSKKVHAITASGVGGGSLVYSNVTLRPHPSVYRNWPTERDGESERLINYFETAENYIGVNKITTVAGLSNQKLMRSKVFQDAAKSLAGEAVINTAQEGYDLNLSITDLPNQLFQTPELFPNYQNPVQTNTCQRQARCNLGCIPGARHTLNKRLFQAISPAKPKKPLPIVVKPLCEAYRIEYNDGHEFPYTIHYKQFDEKTDVPARKEVLAKRLVVAAGTLGTTELLLKSAKGLRLSTKLGTGFSTDGDLFGYMKLHRMEVDITRGPVNTSHAMFKSVDKEFAFSIEDTSLPPMLADFFATIFELFPEARRKSSALEKLDLLARFPALALETLGEISLPTMLKILTAFWRDKNVRALLFSLAKNPNVEDPQTLLLVYPLLTALFKDEERPFAAPSERLNRFFVFSCMGLDNADGMLTLKNGWEAMEESNDKGEKLEVDWRPERNQKIFQEIIKGMRQLAEKIEPGGAQRAFAPSWNESSPKDSTVILLHPLGGCPMGESVETGVVNSFGEVFRPDGQDKKKTYKDFFIVDGSIIPTALGVNSSLTISAVAFRCAERIAGREYWPTITD